MNCLCTHDNNILSRHMSATCNLFILNCNLFNAKTIKALNLKIKFESLFCSWKIEKRLMLQTVTRSPRF